MQQTENYKLNLIETSDPFSPEALNENAETLAAELARVDAALAAKADRTALAAEQTARETVAAAVPKFACGTYVGDGASSRKIDLGFTPRVVYVGQGPNGGFFTNSNGGYYGGLAVTGAPATSGSYNIVTIEEGGFRVYYRYGGTYYSYTANTSGTAYRWFAIG